MSETLAGAATALRRTGDLFGEAAAGLAVLDPGADAFASGPGRLGDLGRDLHAQFQSALDARSREARSHATRLVEAGDVVARAAAGYAEMDDGARRRHREVR
jgi:hypothetical protein